MENKYIILGRPIQWERPVPFFSRRYVYDSQKQTKLSIGLILKKLHNNSPLFCGAIRVDIRFFFAIPEESNHKVGDPYMLVPDWDNLIKLYFDIGNKIIW